jgi:hypothetical protein
MKTSVISISPIFLSLLCIPRRSALALSPRGVHTACGVCRAVARSAEKRRICLSADELCGVLSEMVVAVHLLASSGFASAKSVFGYYCRDWQK